MHIWIFFGSGASSIQKCAQTRNLKQLRVALRDVFKVTVWYSVPDPFSVNNSRMLSGIASLSPQLPKAPPGL